MITLTDIASNKVKQLIDEEASETPLFLRIAVRPGGCSGMSYDIYFDTDRANDDVTTSYGEVMVVVDPESAQFLNGATLDFKDGLQGTGFTMNNPNAQRTCGCGQSFS